MRNNTLRFVLRFVVLPLVACALAACVCLAAQQAVKQETQRFTVLRSDRLVAGTQSLSNAEANCAISGTGSSATMQCRSSGGTLKATYHFITALVVDTKGMGYVIACRVTLTYTWCKTPAPGTVLHGSVVDNGHLAIQDGQKMRDYQVVTTQFIGTPALTQALSPGGSSSAASSSRGGVPIPSRQPAAAVALPPSSSGSTADNSAIPAGDPAATCMSASGVCVSFVSDPEGADIYVDGKFVGDTPSVLTLAVGSHEIRIEAAGQKPWTRTFEATAGSKVTIRAPLEALPPQN